MHKKGHTTSCAYLKIIEMEGKENHLAFTNASSFVVLMLVRYNKNIMIVRLARMIT